MTTPKHDYETVAGTEPTTHGQHQPRTVAHTVTTGNDTDLSMMTEIGDGVFVNWSTCRRCSQQVAGCKCPEGPQEPSYMKPWRDRRFAKDLNTRPDPSYEILDSVIAWVRERGYTVTKSTKKRLAEAKPVPLEDLALSEPLASELAEALDVDEGEQHPEEGDLTYEATDRDRKFNVPGFNVPVESTPDEDEGALPKQVDVGLDAALGQIRAIKAARDDIDPGF